MARGKYFSEFEVGEEFKSVSRTITETDVVLFAGLSGDYNPLHTDKVFAEKTQFIGGIQLHPSKLLSLTLDAGIGVGYVFGGVDKMYFAYNLGFSLGFRF